MLCTVAHSFGIKVPYRPVHKKHPCTLWLLEGGENIKWLSTHARALCAEYTRRYNKRHACLDVIQSIDLPQLLNELPTGATPVRLAMPEEYKREDPVEAYRAYYLGAKRQIATWKSPAAPPDWWY